MPRASSRSSTRASRASLRGRLDQGLKPRVGSGGPVAGHPQRQAQRDQPLLGAVVQVALEPAPLGVAGLDDPRPGGPDLLQLRLHLGLQPGMLQRHAGRGRRELDQLRLVLKPRVVDQDGVAVRGQRHDRPARVRPGRVDRLA